MISLLCFKSPSSRLIPAWQRWPVIRVVEEVAVSDVGAEAVGGAEDSTVPTLLPWVNVVGNRERNNVHMNDRSNYKKLAFDFLLTHAYPFRLCFFSGHVVIHSQGPLTTGLVNKTLHTCKVSRFSFTFVSAMAGDLSSCKDNGRRGDEMKKILLTVR